MRLVGYLKRNIRPRDTECEGIAVFRNVLTVDQSTRYNMIIQNTNVMHLILFIKHDFQLKLFCSIHSVALLSQGTVLQLTTHH